VNGGAAADAIVGVNDSAMPCSSRAINCLAWRVVAPTSSWNPLIGGVQIVLEPRTLFVARRVGDRADHQVLPAGYVRPSK
jgi:hypothetical protein